MLFKNRIQKKFKSLSLVLATMITMTTATPALITEASTGHTVKIGGLSAEQWNSMSDVDRDSYIEKESRATGNTGSEEYVGGWTNGAGPIRIPPVTIDGQVGYCMQPLLTFPVNVYYADPSVSTNTKVRSVAYHGYPNNASGLKEKHGLSDIQAQQYTQFAVWKVLGFVGPGLTFAERTHPYVDELVSLANRGDIGQYTSMEFRLSKNTLEATRYDGYQETEAIGTNGTPGTFTFPSTNEVWSVDLNGNNKNTFNVGESFKIRSTSNFNGVKNLSIKANLGNPTALVYNGNGAYQDILKFSWGDPVEKFAAVNVKFTAGGTISLHKTNDMGLNLQGVKFGLYSDEAATNLIKESITDSNGNITFSDLNEGIYYVKELATLDGHILSDEIKEVKVIAEQINQFDWVNETIKSKVKLLKIDSETGLPMPNVKFTIKAINGLEQGQSWEVVTDESGYISMQLPYGDYEITEVETLEGYILNSTPIKFSVTQNGQVIELSMQNDRVKGNAELLKVDAETKEPLANVVFELECLEGFNQGSKVELVSDSTGIVKISDLQYGKYRLTEIKT
ncbi:SpaA isopeptide-forming pilin-related protein, partial [Clostridium sp.]|uniref:SpaA isopeptide-forming pilin-related protein n=1 Tax=Clostridium sp. TaxID=1506 RepID=UPI003F3FBD64